MSPDELGGVQLEGLGHVVDLAVRHKRILVRQGEHDDCFPDALVFRLVLHAPLPTANRLKKRGRRQERIDKLSNRSLS